MKTLSSLNSVYKYHPDISEQLRAKLIDWILHCTIACGIEEDNIFFIAIDLVDEFYIN